LSLLDTVDARSRVVAALVLSVAVSATHRFSSLGIALLLGGVAVVATRQPPREVVKRLVPVNLFVLILALLSPLQAGPSSLLDFRLVQYNRQAMQFAAMIGLKANAIVLWITALLGSLDIVAVGHALRRLHVPAKLVHLLLFSVRYVDVLQGEAARLKRSMTMRGFRPRINAHTYRSIGYLIGMLLVRSLNRSERIVAAMKCRGFRGQFYVLDDTTLSYRDLCFISVLVLLLAVLGWVEWA
jgi:cobalt/nickel transport system permease protein